MKYLAIGSLPYDNPNDAIDIVKKYFNKIPFWPQLAKVSKNEDMAFQFLEGMPSFFCSEDFKFNTDDENFYKELETFLFDYEQIIHKHNTDKLAKYAINYSSTFKSFLDLAQKAEFAKGQIVGPFTLSTLLTEQNGKNIIYNPTLKELIVKTLSLKALWQVDEIKKTGAIPIIFIDEPSLSLLGSSAYLTITSKDVTEMLKEISDLIKKSGGISAIHCCGKCDWSSIIKAEPNIISFDAYNYAENISIFSDEIKLFVNNGGKLAWGIVPTLDREALKNATLEYLEEKFNKAVTYLTNKGINEKLIIENSYITPSCGAGSLPEDLAQKAMKLTKELAERYNDN